MTTARKLEPTHFPSESIPASQDWGADTWLDEIARAHGLTSRERDLLDQPPHRDPVGEQVVRRLVRRQHLRLVA